MDTLSLFGVQCRYDIHTDFPLVTRRKYAYKSIFAELLWMLSGSTNVNDLEALGSKIWTSWRSKEFETKNNYKDGELGPIYGWQFKHFGGNYDNRDNPNEGFDQVSNIINQIKQDKSSRRLMINLWNPIDMFSDKVRLPCCHYAINFLIEGDKLTGILHQRSGDVLPGVSANIMFYSAFIYMIAQQTGLKPYQLVHNIDNAHIYVNQIDAAKEYLSRSIVDSPQLILANKQMNDYKVEDFNIVNYNPLDAIKVPVMI